MEAPGERLLIRLIDLLETSVGGILRPWQTRRTEKANADARANERLVLEQAEVHVREVRLGRKRVGTSGLLVDADRPPTLLLEGSMRKAGEPLDDTTSFLADFQGHVGMMAAATALQRAINLKKIALLAEEEAELLEEQQASESERTASHDRVDG